MPEFEITFEYLCQDCAEERFADMFNTPEAL